jgi:hypothetical protein
MIWRRISVQAGILHNNAFQRTQRWATFSLASASNTASVGPLNLSVNHLSLPILVLFPLLTFRQKVKLADYAAEMTLA